MSDRDWLQNLKVGDKVIEDKGVFGNNRIATVKRLTNTQVVVSAGTNLLGQEYEVKYRKDYGTFVGADKYAHGILREATPEAVAEIKESQYRTTFQNKLRELSWSNVPLETIKQIQELIEPYLPKKEKN
jgi:hypothetical protein